MEHRENLDAAKSEERAARDLLRSKRQEMDSVQSKINIVKNAINVEDIGARVCTPLSFSTKLNGEFL
jgi:hypothetical protein